jgi:hypothetical protein
MKLSDIKNILPQLDNVTFKLADGSAVPAHFHVTEIGLISKHFIDCGGTIRKENVVNFQLWDANDHDHRLKPQKLLNIIELSERKLAIGDHEIEVEYQAGTIGKFELDFDGVSFLLLNKQTACLASDQCGTPAAKKFIDLGSITNTNSCTPGGSCC